MFTMERESKITVLLKSISVVLTVVVVSIIVLKSNIDNLADLVKQLEEKINQPTNQTSDPCSGLTSFGWTAIQRRLSNSQNFRRNLTDYRKGFGDHNSEFFIGLDKLHSLTKSQTHELYILLENSKNEVKCARYSHFAISNELDGFQLISVGNYTGTAGDSLSSHLYNRFHIPDTFNTWCKIIYWRWWDYPCDGINGLPGIT